MTVIDGTSCLLHLASFLSVVRRARYTQHRSAPKSVAGFEYRAAKFKLSLKTGVFNFLGIPPHINLEQ
jgi:hypothetical protein